jgi:hypothetical protein
MNIIKKFFLRRQIKKVIKIYEKALLKENLTIEYCKDNNIDRGICELCRVKSYNLLKYVIFNKLKLGYIHETPNVIKGYRIMNLDIDDPNTRESLKIAHETRIKFLKSL